LIFISKEVDAKNLLQVLLRTTLNRTSLIQKSTMASKYAFLVGVNEYADPSITDLGGCVSDVTDMGDTLVACGFPYENIVIRTDSRATKEAADQLHLMQCGE
jgi:hypothetical protein